MEQINEFVRLLEMPFGPSVLEWRVTNTTKGDARPRGLQSMGVKSMNHLDNLESLHKIVLAVEARVAKLP